MPAAVAAERARSARRRQAILWRDYLSLTKPRVMTLLLLTGAAGLIVGGHGLPAPQRALAALVGLALACGGAAALNHYLDRDIDPLMGPRTRARPVAAGRIAPRRALAFGLLLTISSFLLLATATHIGAALLALAGNLFYVLVYTRFLKRRTSQNIVIGGTAGAIPSLVGYTAATGHVGAPALLLALVVFVWTPPHFWALALLLEDDYAAAGVPMLPVVKGDRHTTRMITAYTLCLVGVSLLPATLGHLGLLYAAPALILGSAFIALALQLQRHTSRRAASRLFHYSLLYLALLFAAAATAAAAPI